MGEGLIAVLAVCVTVVVVVAMVLLIPRWANRVDPVEEAYQRLREAEDRLFRTREDGSSSDLGGLPLYEYSKTEKLVQKEKTPSESEPKVQDETPFELVSPSKPEDIKMMVYRPKTSDSVAPVCDCHKKPLESGQHVALVPHTDGVMSVYCVPGTP